MVSDGRKLSQGKRLEEVIPPAKDRNAAFRRVILQIPKGQVTTYGQVAAAAGYPRNHRAVAQFLRSEPPNRLPWHRVVGAGGEIKLQGEAAAEQRLRLRMEGVSFSGRRVNLKLHGFKGPRRSGLPKE
ncbi:MAG TPA: MGMT family protein [Bryobacteraceae bacterium]|jgi:methylated-DNA-protein-cysteine methyltransferase-like protein|nr:MGMT family protein [Bryobacteraceae bacterium]